MVAQREAGKAAHVATVIMALDCEELGLKAKVLLPAGAGRVPFPKLASALAAGGLFGSCFDATQQSELERFDTEVQRREVQRNEQQEFYSRVEARFSDMAETMARMKRDYYREIDNLREQISRMRGQTDFQPDPSVVFFDPSGYRLPSWYEILEELDGLRMKRELLEGELGANRVKQVPLHMLCPRCRGRFQSPEEALKAYNEDHREFGVQTEGCDIADMSLIGTSNVCTSTSSNVSSAGSVCGDVTGVAPCSGRNSTRQSTANILGSRSASNLTSFSGEVEGVDTGMASDLQGENFATLDTWCSTSVASEAPPGEDKDENGSDDLVNQEGFRTHLASSDGTAVSEHLDVKHGPVGMCGRNEDHDVGEGVSPIGSENITTRGKDDQNTRRHGSHSLQMTSDNADIVEPLLEIVEETESQRDIDSGDVFEGIRKRKQLTDEEIHARAELMGSRLENLFSKDPKIQCGRAFKLWRQKKMSKKELAERRRQRQLEAYQRHLTRVAFGAWKREVDANMSINSSPQSIYGRGVEEMPAPLRNTTNESFGRTNPVSSKTSLKRGQIESADPLDALASEDLQPGRRPSSSGETFAQWHADTQARLRAGADTAQGSRFRVDKDSRSRSAVIVGNSTSATLAGPLGRTADLRDSDNLAGKPRRNSRHLHSPSVPASAFSDVATSGTLRNSPPPTPQMLRVSASTSQLGLGSIPPPANDRQRPLSGHRVPPAELEFGVVGRRTGFAYSQKANRSLTQTTSLPRLVRA